MTHTRTRQVELRERGTYERPEPGTTDIGDAFSTTVTNPDGSFTATLSTRPQRWLDGEGAWRAFENRLIAASESDTIAAFESASGPYTARFSSAAAVSGGEPAVRMAQGDAAIALTALGAKPTSAVSGDATLTYRSAWADADLRYTLDNERIKEEILLARAPRQAPTFEFELAVAGLTVEELSGGGLAFVDERGMARFSMPPLWMSDSAEVRAEARVGYEWSSDGDTVRLVVRPDHAWLTDRARVYPVAIDPTLINTIWRAEDDAAENVRVNQAAPTTNYYGATTLSVGKAAGGQRSDALLLFPSIGTMPADTVVISADIEVEVQSGTNGMGLELLANTAAFEDSTVTWNTAPAFNATPLDTATATVGGAETFSVTGLVDDWVRGGVTNGGVRIRSTGSNGQSAALYSSWYSCATCGPQLELTYVPTTRYGTNSLWTQTSTDYGGGNSAAVEVSGGNVMFRHAGGSIGGRGFNVDLTHTYNSADPIGLATGGGAGVFGEGWTFGWNLRLFEVDSPGAVVFKDGSGDESRVFVNAGTSGGVRNYSAPIHYGYTLIEDTSSPPADKVWTLTNDVGGTEHFFDAEGKLTRIEDRNGNYLAFTYDGSDRLITITDVADRDTTLIYGGPGGRLSQVTDMAGRVSTYGYDGDANLTTITHASGSADEVTTTLGYDDAHQLTSVTTPNGDTSEIRYTAINDWESGVQGWVANEGDPVLSQDDTHVHSGDEALKVALSGVTATDESIEREFDPPQALSATAPELLVWVYRPTGSGPLSAKLGVEVLDNGDSQSAWTSLIAGTWTAVSIPSAHVEALDQVFEMELNFEVPGGTPAFTGSVWVDDLAVRGQVASQSDAAASPNTIVTYSYLPNDRQTQVARPNSAGSFQATTYAYDALGMVTSVTDPVGLTTSYARDNLLRLTSVTPPGVGAVPYQLGYYPNSMQLQTAANGTNEVSRRGAGTNGDGRYAIDPLNEQLRATASDYDATVFTRDASGNVLAAISGRYDGTDDLEDDPFPTALSEHRRVEFDHTTGGLLDTMTDPLGRETFFDYDIDTGYLTEISAEPGSGEGTRRVTTFTRNSDGSVDTMTDPAGQVTSFEYDNLGRLTDTTYDDGGGGEFSVSYTLDDNGNLVALTDAAGSSDWDYDENNQVIEEGRTQNSITKTAEYGYFANGTLQTITTFANQTVTFAYDNALRLTSQTDPNDGGASIAFGYDDRGRRDTITYPSGVVHTQTFDDAGRLADILLEKANGTDLQRFSYDYGFDGNGDRTADYQFGFAVGVDELSASTDFEYDALGRLVAAARTGTGAYHHLYDYDDANNRTSLTVHQFLSSPTTTYTYDDANQLVDSTVTSLTTTYDYDRNGNLVELDGPQTGDTDTFTYDAANDVMSADVDGVDLDYSSDGLGRQVSRTADAARTDFWFDRSGMTLETGASDLTHLRDPSGLALSVDDGSDLLNLGRDRLGSITAETDDTETLVASRAYQPYGSPVAASGTHTSSLGFTGGRLDPDTTWYTLGQRTYAPELARFTTLDPLPASITDLNRYAYAAANPANFIDPTGLAYCDLNVTGGFLGIGTVGLLIGEGEVHLYIGGGLGAGLSASATCSPNSISTGINWGFQGVGAGLAGQFGSDASANYYVEGGVGFGTGVSLTGFWVF